MTSGFACIFRMLKKTVILKPKWGTDAVYRVLDDAGVIEARGRFNRDDLSRIWSGEKYAGMQDELLQLMMKFQLCYALENEREFIAPQLLSSDQPAYPWDASSGVTVRYKYEFLPKGIVTRFIVVMNHFIATEKLVWKTGVVLEREGSLAEVIEEYGQKRIRVRVSGPNQRGLLSIIDEQLERIHRSFPRLSYDRHLPCPCTECRGKAEPYAFPLASLRNMADKRREIQCHESGEMVDAAELISDVLGGRFSEHARLEPSREVFVSYRGLRKLSSMVSRRCSKSTAFNCFGIATRSGIRTQSAILCSVLGGAKLSSL